MFDVLKEKIINNKTTKDLYNNTQNCYAYSTGLSDRALEPGYISGDPIKDDFSVDDVAEAVIADLKSVGRNARVVEGPDSYLKSNEYMIAIRITENPIFLKRDYHFMVRDDDGVWSEKKGIYSSNKVLGTPESFGAWSPRMNSKTVYLAITKD